MRKFLIVLSLIMFSIFGVKTFAQENLSELAVAYYSDNNIDSSLECLLQINDKDKTESDYLLIGNIYEEKKDTAKAIENWKKALIVNPKYYKGYYNLGHIYTEQKDYIKAIYYYNNALKYEKENPYINYNLGYVYLKSGEIKKAHSEFMNAVKKQDNVPEFLYNLAYTYKKLGKKKQSELCIANYNKLMENKF